MTETIDREIEFIREFVKLKIAYKFIVNRIRRGIEIVIDKDDFDYDDIEKLKEFCDKNDCSFGFYYCKVIVLKKWEEE